MVILVCYVPSQLFDLCQFGWFFRKDNVQNCQLWSPRTLGLIRKVEGVQRLLTSKIQGCDQKNYWERLENLGLYSLERRRERYMIIYIWKLINGLVCDTAQSGQLIETYSHARRGILCRIPPLRRARASVQTLKDNSFLVCGPKLFNCLPKDMREHQGSMQIFKSRLDSFLKEIPDKPSLPHYYQRAASNCIVDQLAQMRSS